MSVYKKNNGTWKNINGIYVKNSGTWQGIKQAYVKNGSIWKKVFDNEGGYSYKTHWNYMYTIGMHINQLYDFTAYNRASNGSTLLENDLLLFNTFINQTGDDGPSKFMWFITADPSYTGGTGTYTAYSESDFLDDIDDIFTNRFGYTKDVNYAIWPSTLDNASGYTHLMNSYYTGDGMKKLYNGIQHYIIPVFPKKGYLDASNNMVAMGSYYVSTWMLEMAAFQMAWGCDFDEEIMNWPYISDTIESIQTYKKLFQANYNIFAPSWIIDSDTTRLGSTDSDMSTMEYRYFQPTMNGPRSNNKHIFSNPLLRYCKNTISSPVISGKIVNGYSYYYSYNDTPYSTLRTFSNDVTINVTDPAINLTGFENIYRYLTFDVGSTYYDTWLRDNSIIRNGISPNMIKPGTTTDILTPYNNYLRRPCMQPYIDSGGINAFRDALIELENNYLYTYQTTYYDTSTLVNLYLHNVNNISNNFENINTSRPLLEWYNVVNPSNVNRLPEIMAM